MMKRVNSIRMGQIRLLRLLLILLLVALSDVANAGWYIEETFFPVYISKNDASNPAGGSASADVPTESGTGLDYRTTIGYLFGGDFFLGFTYNSYSVSTSRPFTANYEGLNTTTTKSEMGATLGYFPGSWRFMVTLFTDARKSASQTYTGPGNSAVSLDELYTNSAGAGYQLSVGYGFSVGKSLVIGPALIFKSLSYSRQTYEVRAGSGTPYSDSELQTKAIDTEVKPMVSMSYLF